jgi:glutamate-ammonia-ligase adenylyltransferase
MDTKTSSPRSFAAGLDVLLQGSNAAKRLLLQRPELGDQLQNAAHLKLSALAQQLSSSWQSLASAASLGSRLRHDRSLMFLHSAYRDLNQLADLQEVVQGWTDFADQSVMAACRVVGLELQDRYGIPRDEAGNPQVPVIIAMGKMGGAELNVSSDIDLVFCYPQSGQTDGPTALDLSDYFARLVRQFSTLLEEPTAEGFVFRVDLRLRPDGRSGPAALSFDALEQYLEIRGRPWERHAWLKARAVGVEPLVDQALQDIVRPFVYRRYLDFGTLASLRELHDRMQEDDSIKNREEDLKLGIGGIRQLEFTAQVTQLIRGGDEPLLQVRSTREALRRLEQRGYLDKNEALDLLAAYDFLRRAEHRVQYREDAQTHALPPVGPERNLLAETMGFGTTLEFEQTLQGHRQRVHQLFRRFMGLKVSATETPAATADIHPLWQALMGGHEETARLLWKESFGTTEALGFAHLKDFLLSRAWRSSHEEGRKRLTKLLSQCLHQAQADPAQVPGIGRVCRVFNSIAGRETYFSLLTEYPFVLERLMRICSASAWLAEQLARTPLLLDELVNPSAARQELTAAVLRQEIAQCLAGVAKEQEARMDALRRTQQRLMFRLALVDLEQEMDVREVSDRLSDLADACLAAVVQELDLGPGFSVVGFGKLGGKELGYGSDLDLVFVYDPEQIPGEKAARAAQRLITWMSTPTTAGILYEVDVALRPDGASGLLVSSLPAFQHYQRERAWVWEHQALTRARVCAGDPQLGRAVEALREEIITRPRDLNALAGEILSMRSRMRREQKIPAGQWEIKKGEGGLIDLEFLVQFLILAHAHDHPELTANSGNMALLHRLGELHLAPAHLCERAALAYGLFRRRHHRDQLAGAGETPKIPADNTGHLPLEAGLAIHARDVSALWLKVFQGYAEGQS